MNVAVAYASKHGSTRQIAERIAAVLRVEGIEADVGSAEKIGDLESYDAVILGSAVYMGRWRPEAWRFVRRHRERLTAVPLWLFSSGPVGKPGEEVPQTPAPLRVYRTGERLEARGHVIFGGRVPDEPGGFLERSVANSVATKLRDSRNWDAIEAWARAIAKELAGTPAGALV